MLSTHTIRTVAKYEMRTLIRGWFFRIFAGLSILSLGIFNAAVYTAASGSPWLYRAIPANVPYVNIIVLNLGQAIVAMFLASEFLKQDRKNDTVEVIYARSMTNAEYIFGKTLGILSVFMVLNVIILSMGIGFSFISNDSAKGIGELFYYPLLISMPTLVFILGLSFLLMSVLKNQAITFIIILGYIALTIFYLNTKFYHLFDYIAYQVPMVYSTIDGFGNFQEILIHRGIYFFIGLGLIFFTTFRLQRLPQAKTFKTLPLFLAILFLALAGFLTNKYINLKKGNIELKQQMIAINDTYVHFPKVEISTCEIDLTHLGEEIRVKSRLTIINKNNSILDTTLIMLNPSLAIESILINDETVEYIRDIHLIKVINPISMNPGDIWDLKINYQGSINENTHFLDADLENYEDNFSLEIFRVRKRYAYLKEKYVCLTSEALWYPISGVGFSSLEPALYYPDFTNYKLTVSTTANLLPVSQGKSIDLGEGKFEFINDYPLPKISLLIADYSTYSIKVDSIEYNLYATKGNEYFVSHFENFADSLPAIIRSLKNEYESQVGLTYPFKRFSLAEVPIQFALDKHTYSLTSDAVQPEITFFSEKGVVLEETDFKKRKSSSERRAKRDNEELSPEELQSRIFKRFVRSNFMANQTESYQFEEVVDRNTFSLFPNYYDFVTQLKSKEWPMLNISLSTYLKVRNENAVSSNRWFFEGMSKGERINLELKEASLEELIKNGVEVQTTSEDIDEIVRLNDIILAKGDYLFSLFKSRYGAEEFNQLLNEFVENHQHKSFSFNEFNTTIQAYFNESVTDEINDWYTNKELPGFLIKDLDTYKVLDGEYAKYQVRFKIANPENIDGLVTINIDLDNQQLREDNNQITVDFSRQIFIPARSAKEVGFVFTTEPNRMNIFTHISKNLPNNIIYDFDSYEETKKVPIFDEVRDCPLFTDLKEPNETIVDNEDEGFEIIQSTNKSYLKALVDKNKKQAYKYTRIKTWDPPAEWKSVLRSGFYGKYVRSAEYTSSGGEERSAVWKANLEKAAFYDVYCNLEKLNIYSRGRRIKYNYQFKIHHEDGLEEVTLYDEEIEDGWNFLGSFFITPETAKVELTNTSTGRLIFADAIKWVEL